MLRSRRGAGFALLVLGLALAIGAARPSAGASRLPGDLMPPGGDGRWTIADLVRLIQLVSDQPSGGTDRQIAGLSPCSETEVGIACIGSSGSGIASGISFQMSYSQVDLSFVREDVELLVHGEPIVELVNLEAPGFLAVTTILPFDAQVSIPTLWYGVHYEIVGATSVPSLQSCTVSDMFGAEVATATCEVSNSLAVPCLPDSSAASVLDTSDIEVLRSLVVQRTMTAPACSR